MAASSDDRGNERSGGGGDEQEERTDGWMATYADMVTLLMTFFVLMFALSNADTEKAQLFMFAMSREGLTADQFWEIRDRFTDPIEDHGWDDMLPGLPSEGGDDPGGLAALQAIYNAMVQYIEAEDLDGEISIVYDGEYLLMRLASDILFASAETQITPANREKAEVIARILRDTFIPEYPVEVVVAGHTDNVPISTPQYPSNWHISNERAGNFLWVLLSESGLSPGLFSSRAYGEYKPIASNNTDEGKATNRRVEIMISLARDNPLWNRVDD
ncbi:MAG: OmpA family protein [Oscillospiraceae bacterium]|nr:OmpA family protein [Oscillospiraceae bacterium]